MARIHKAATLRYRLERKPRISEQRSGKLESQPLLILQRRKAGSCLKSAYQITRAHAGELSQPGQSNRFGKMRAQPILDSMDTRMQVVAEREVNAGLGVATLSSDKDHEVAGHLGGQTRTIVQFNEGERHVNS